MKDYSITKCDFQKKIDTLPLSKCDETYQTISIIVFNCNNINANPITKRDIQT